MTVPCSGLARKRLLLAKSFSTRSFDCISVLVLSLLQAVAKMQEHVNVNNTLNLIW
ncbi:hypothetical protein D050_0482 [Vibrio parahaemolyticus VPCR-2009]|nr:hypothetical protein D050_0482 [Vibrio parahaemolyticus VPCR-2009]